MIKNKFIKATFILIIGGFISKLLAMFIRITLSRKIGPSGIGLYMLILPTFQLFIILGNLGFPVSISKLVSEQRKNNKKLVLSIIPFIIIYNLLLMLILLFISPLISNLLLKNLDTLYPLMAIGLTLPCITISDVMRGYFFGKQKSFPYVFSNIIEQLVRLFLTIFFIPNLLKFSIPIAVTGVVLINIVSEFSSILMLLVFIPKDVTIKVQDFKKDIPYLKDNLAIGIPTTSFKLVSSIGNFFEPIIITSICLFLGYNNNYITYEYGIINGYVLPLLLLPSFFSSAISNALLPVISNNFSNNKISEVKRKIKQAIILALSVGGPATLFLTFFPDILLNLLYGTTIGSSYIKMIAPFFIFHYIQAPLTSTLQGMGKAKCAMKGSIGGTILRIITLLLCLLLGFKFWSVLISLIISIVYVTGHNIYYVQLYLKEKTKIFFV